jgi:HSP20 family protein
MAEAESKPVKIGERAEKLPSALQSWRPFESLQRQMDRLFDNFYSDFWQSRFRQPVFDIEPSWQRPLGWGTAPAVDIVEKDDAYDIAAELPGLDEKDIEVKLTNGKLTIKGEKQEEKEEKKKDYYLHERHFGLFERSFQVPEGIDTDKIEANFNKGVLTVKLPKKPEAQKPEKEIQVKAA